MGTEWRIIISDENNPLGIESYNIERYELKDREINIYLISSVNYDRYIMQNIINNKGRSDIKRSIVIKNISPEDVIRLELNNCWLSEYFIVNDKYNKKENYTKLTFLFENINIQTI